MPVSPRIFTACCSEAAASLRSRCSYEVLIIWRTSNAETNSAMNTDTVVTSVIFHRKLMPSQPSKRYPKPRTVSTRAAPILRRRRWTCTSMTRWSLSQP